MNTALSHGDFVRAAGVLGCEVAAIKAVAEVESPKGGFLPSGRLTVLFEGHKFYKYTQGKYALSHPTLCFREWNEQTRKFYKGGEAEWDERLNVAIALDRRAALLSASYGRFQVMGFNHKACGFPDVERFVANLGTGEPAQLDAFVRYIAHRRLEPALKSRDWAAFALAYNGAGYAVNQYDVRMARAYAKHTAVAA